MPNHRRYSYSSGHNAAEYAWPASRKQNRGTGTFSRIAAKRSIQALGIAILLILLLSFASYSHRKTPSKPLVEVQKSAPKTGKYAIITFETRDVTYWKESLGNKFEYARRHGYANEMGHQADCRYDLLPTFQSPRNDDVGGVWTKIFLTHQELASGKYDWILWMDFDTLFTNMSTRIEDFLDDAKTNHLNKFNNGQTWEDVDIIAAADWFAHHLTFANLVNPSMPEYYSSAIQPGQKVFYRGSGECDGLRIKASKIVYEIFSKVQTNSALGGNTSFSFPNINLIHIRKKLGVEKLKNALGRVATGLSIFR